MNKSITAFFLLVLFSAMFSLCGQNATPSHANKQTAVATPIKKQAATPPPSSKQTVQKTENNDKLINQLIKLMQKESDNKIITFMEQNKINPNDIFYEKEVKINLLSAALLMKKYNIS